MKIKVKDNIFKIYCDDLTKAVFKKLKELLSINNNVRVEVYVNNNK